MDIRDLKMNLPGKIHISGKSPLFPADENIYQCRFCRQFYWRQKYQDKESICSIHNQPLKCSGTLLEVCQQKYNDPDCWLFVLDSFVQFKFYKNSNK